MAIESTPPLLSYDDYAAIDDDARYEVLDGALVPMGPAPFLRHQWVAGQIYKALDTWAQASGAGFVFVAPVDGVVEALSPSNARKDAVRKRDLYARFGVSEYWIVPEACDRVEILRLDPGGTYGRPTLVEPAEVLTSPQLPGFEVTCGLLFPPDPADG